MDHDDEMRDEVVRGATNVADNIRSQLVTRGRRSEEIGLAWFPDSTRVPAPESAELKAMLSETGAVRLKFSQDQLAVSSKRLEREPVVAKINPVVESLHAGLP